tara:strand:+ start:546 stop:1040 length:495 start_codon:yes stop_codon:yes gene_type:complete
MKSENTIKFNFYSDSISVSTFSSFLRNLQVSLRALGKDISETSIDFSGSNAPSLSINKMNLNEAYEIEIKFSYKNNDYDSLKSDLIFTGFLAKTFESCENSAQKSLWGSDVIKRKTSQNKSSLKPDSTNGRIVEFVDHLKRMGDSDVVTNNKTLSIRNKFASLS